MTLGQRIVESDARGEPAARVELVVKHWGSLAPGEVPVPDWQRDLIRERLAVLDHVLPEERSVPWEAVRKRVFSDKT